MKKFNIALGLVALLAAATSCDKYDIYPEQYGKVMMIKDAGDRSVTIYATEETQPSYVSVMKGGHTPEDPSTAVLKVLSDEEFAAYLEKYYGNSEFEGLIPLDPDFYYLADADGNAIGSTSYTHEFSNADDRYFGVNVMFKAQDISDWWEDLSNQSDAQSAGILNGAYSVVVPIGLFSPNDSVNADNQYLMIQPSVEDPVMSISVADGGYYIEDISRSKLLEDPDYLATSIEPAVTLSIPCSNPYGFTVKVDSKKTYIDQFMTFHTDIQLNAVTDSKVRTLDKKPHFEKGVTEIRMPLTFLPEYMDAEQLDVNYVVPITFVADDRNSHMIWGSGEGDVASSEVPAKVKKSLKLPSSTTTWYNSSGQLQSFGDYTIFIGYRVQETPLEITEDCILAQNDCEPTEGSAAYLFDDDLSTFYHSAWSDPQYRSAPYGSYIDFEMPTKDLINAVAIQVTARVHSNPMAPKTITLFYTNEYNTADPDNSYWTPFEADANGDPVTYNITGADSSGKLGSGKVGWFGGITKDSEWLRASGDFRYLRFSALVAANGDDLTQTGTSTTGYWNLAEMRIYGKKF